MNHFFRTNHLASTSRDLSPNSIRLFTQKTTNPLARLAEYINKARLRTTNTQQDNSLQASIAKALPKELQKKFNSRKVCVFTTNLYQSPASITDNQICQTGGLSDCLALIVFNKKTRTLTLEHVNGSDPLFNKTTLCERFGINKQNSDDYTLYVMNGSSHSPIFHRTTIPLYISQINQTLSLDQSSYHPFINRIIDLSGQSGSYDIIAYLPPNQDPIFFKSIFSELTQKLEYTPIKGEQMKDKINLRSTI